MGLPRQLMLENMSSQEINEWMAYERVAGPLGPERHDVLSAMTQSTIANAANSKKGKKYEPRQFMPRWDTGEKEDPQSKLHKMFGTKPKE